MQNVENIKNDFKWLYNDKYQHVEWEDFLIHWHDSVGEYCIYIKDKWSGYVDEFAIYKSGLQNYKRWNEYWEKYRQSQIHMDYHYMVMRVLHEDLLTDDLVLDILSNRSYPKDYRLMTLNILKQYFQNSGRSTDLIDRMIEADECENNSKGSRQNSR